MICSGFGVSAASQHAADYLQLTGKLTKQERSERKIVENR
jgi:hypothetical protein